MTKTKKRGQPEYNRNFDIGDIVSLIGEDTKIYRIVCYKEIHEVNEDEAPLGYTEYILANAENDEDWWDVGYDEDMSLLAKAADADKFLRNRQAKERRKATRRGGRHPLTVDDLLSDLHSYIEVRRELPPGPMFDVMGDMIPTVKKALEKRTGGER